MPAGPRPEVAEPCAPQRPSQSPPKEKARHSTDSLAELSLSEFAEQDVALELRVEWLDQTLWWVPRTEHVDQFLKQGVARGRIWTARELMDLADLPGRTRDDIEKIARLKLAFGAEIESVGPASDADADA